MAHKWTCGCLGGLFVLALGFVLWWQHSMSLPQVVIPPAAMPNPNAIDAYRDASQLIRQVNGYDVLVNGVGLANAQCLSLRGRLSVGPEAKPWDVAKKQRALERYAHALAEVRTASGFAARWSRPTPDSPSWWDGADVVLLAGAFRLDAENRSRHGDPAGAANSAMDCLHMAANLSHGAPLTGAYAAFDCESLVLAAMDEVTPHLTPRQAQALAKRLAGIRSRRATLAATLEDEKWFCVRNAIDYLASQESRNQSFGDVFAGNVNEGNDERWQRMLRANRSHVVQDYLKTIDAMIARAKRPYVSSDAIPPDAPMTFGDRVPLRYADVARKFATADARLGMLELKLAILASRGDHGRYPSSLDDLVPTYLDGLPVDPFTLGKPFQYVRTGNGFGLSSVGAH